MAAATFRRIPLALTLLALASAPSIVRAQGNAFNPYGNSGYADYREFTVPSTSNNPALPGQARLNNEPLITRPRPNSFRQYTDDLEGTSESSQARRGSSAGVPYTEAYQQLNKQYNRVYRANDSTKNQEFVDRLKQRDLAFAKALLEKDPVKRSKLLRQLDNDAIERTGTAATPKAKAATTRAPEPNSVPRGSSASRAPSPATTTTAPAPGSRRTTTTPAPPLNGTRRPNPSNSGPPPVPGVTGTRTSSNKAPAPATPANSGGTLTPPL